MRFVTTVSWNALQCIRKRHRSQNGSLILLNKAILNRGACPFYQTIYTNHNFYTANSCTGVEVPKQDV